MTAATCTHIGAIVLAAGFSNRFGNIKLCAPLPDGRSVFAHTLSAVAAAIDDIIVVTRDEVAPLLPPHNARQLVFPDAEQGMGASLAYGISKVPDWDGCLVCLADMPAVRPDTYIAIRDNLRPDRILVPRFQQQSGNPCAFSRRYFPELARLRGDRGGRVVIQQFPQSVDYLEVDDPAILLDIDTPDDLAGFQITR